MKHKNTMLPPYRFVHSTIGLFGETASNVETSKDGILQFKLPDLGEGMDQCEIRKWYVKEGDSVKKRDKVCLAESDKSTLEITSPYTGIVKKLYHKENEVVKVGTSLMDISIPSSSSSSPSTSPSLKPTPTTINSDRTASNVNNDANTSSIPISTDAHTTTSMTPMNEGKFLATPAVRHMARKHNISLREVPATGRDGRILKEDMLAYLNLAKRKSTDSIGEPSQRSQLRKEEEEEEYRKQQQQQQRPSSLSKTSPLSSPLLKDMEVPLSGYARVMAKTMTASNAVPQFGYCDEIIADKLIRLRHDLKAIAERHGVKLTYMPIIIKATSLALRQFPMLNSHYDDSKGTLTYRASHNIGVAINTSRGLAVPNIKNVQNKSIFEIALEFQRVQEAALRTEILREDLLGGTFTLSNIGSIGGTYASPLLLVPEVTIAAIGKIQKLPRYDEKGNLIPMHLFSISWSADHRVIDGATIASFSNLWKHYLEDPSTMLFETK